MKRRPPKRLLPRHSTLRKFLLFFAVPVILFSLVWSFTAPVASQHSPTTGIEIGGPAGPENFDIRSPGNKTGQLKRESLQKRHTRKENEQRATRGQRMKEASVRLAAQLGGLRITESDLIDAPEVVGMASGRRKLTSRSGEAHEKIVRRFLESNEDLYGLSAKQVARLRKISEYTNPAGNLSWVSLEQHMNNIPVFQGELRAALTSAGELVQTTGTLAPEVEEKGLKSKGNLSAVEAIARAAETIGVAVNSGDLTLKDSSADGQTFIFSGGPFADDTKVELVYFPLGAGLVELGWSMVLWQDPQSYYIIVDAENGELFFRKNITDYQTQPATYSYYNDDSPAPLSPSTATPGSGIQGTIIGRTLATLIGEHLLGDPWLPDGVTTTTGNNVDAGMDLATPNGIDVTGRPVSLTRNFDFPYNPGPGSPPPGDSPTLANYRNGESVNMFVWTNRYHDRLYQLGFTEAARNFQQNNYGRNPGGGTANAIAGNDRVLAEGQDSSGTDNANFSTPADGSSGRMQMYIFTGPTPDRTSGIDHDILIHELTHGTSNRLHANASGLATTMSGGMGEGWSDFYARALLSTADEDVNGVYAAGAYATLGIVAGFTDNYYYGIRRFPYAVKTNLGPNGKPHNPLTFADIDPTQINLTDGAFPRGPIGSSTAFQVHNVGEVWCMSLLEARARLITRSGHAIGNQLALQLVTDGMKLDPASPTLVEGRNSILTANCAVGGPDASANELDIWQGFATRGLGFSASAVSSSSSSVKEAFDLPNAALGAITISNDSCDNSGFADPGETVTLNIPLSNPFCATSLTGVTATITGGGTANYGTIAPGASATQGISFTVPSGAACGSQISVPIEISSSLGTVTRNYTLQVGAPTSTGATSSFSTGNIAVPLPDLVGSTPGVAEIPVLVPNTGFVGDVNVRVRLNHTFDADLALALIAPDGTTVNLSNNRGGSGDNFGTGANDCSGTPTTFDDEAAVTIASGVAPFASSFRPDSPLSALDGKEMNGTWKLRVTDTGLADVGTAFCVTLDITPQLYYCCGVPGTPIMQAAPPAVLVAESALPANNAPDPDETVTMSFPLKNVGTGVTTNLVATLLPGGGVNAPSGPQNYGVLSPIGPAVARNFTFVPSGTCGSDITATFHLQDGATDLGNVTFTIRLGAVVTTVTTGANPANIKVPNIGTGAGTGAPSAPYPSTIPIAGVTGTVSKVTATIHNFSHTWPDDVDILLVGPGGQKVILMSDVGDGATYDLVNATLTFDDASTVSVPTTPIPSNASTTYRPTNVGTTDPFPAPAPVAPYGSALSAFNGGSPNGVWSLYVVDDTGADAGNIVGGWSLTITTGDPSCAFSPCTLGVSNITQANDPGMCGAIVNFAPTITGSCGVVTSAPPSGSFFVVGTTPVVVTGTRQDSSTTTAGFNVTVNDTELPAVSASLTRVGHASHSNGDFKVGFSATDNCAVASLRAVIWTPAGAETFRVSYDDLDDDDDDHPSPDAKIIIDYDRRRITLEGRNRTALRNLLTQLLANGGASVVQNQVLRLQLHKPDDDDDDHGGGHGGGHGNDHGNGGGHGDNDFRSSHSGNPQIGRYEFSFRHGVLIKVKAPHLELKATAVDIHGNVGTASAFPVFPHRHRGHDRDCDDDHDDDHDRDHRDRR